MMWWQAVLYAANVLQFLTQPCYRYVQLFTVFGYCAAGNVIALFHQHICQVFIREWLAFVFALYHFVENGLYLARRYFLAILIMQRFREEVLQNVGAIFGLHILAVCNPRY